MSVISLQANNLTSLSPYATDLRNRPFNLKGGGYGFLFRSEFFFRATQELEYFFFFVA